MRSARSGPVLDRWIAHLIRLKEIDLNFIPE